jgi:putative tryptophan/tyrosine transport system substrate-binding protein
MPKQPFSPFTSPSPPGRRAFWIGSATTTAPLQRKRGWPSARESSEPGPSEGFAVGQLAPSPARRHRWVIGKHGSAVLIVALALLAAPLAATAQRAGKVYRVGWLSFGSPAAFSTRLNAFRQGLRDLGYTGQSIVIEQRWAEGREALLPDLAAELVGLKVDVLVSVGTPATRAARRATDTIPIVMVAVGDPVGTGLVASLARPGRNITGISNLAADLSGKILDLLREAVPKVSRVAVLLNPANPVHTVYRREMRVAAEALGLKLQAVEVRVVEDFEGAFATMARGRADALIVPPDPLNLIHRGTIVNLAAKNRLPAIYEMRDYPDAGGLMSYGPNPLDLHRHAATYVHKILKGAKPADLPVQQPTRFELVVNMRTAKALGLTIPPSVLVRADQMIE